jgi:3-methyladenine DNA glycosylase AlkD
MAEAMTDWGQDEELWIRRCAVLSQVRRKERTREEILFQLASGHLHETTFWMRKAIGWALREYGKAAPEAVARFVADHEEEMAGLTRREATKYL